MSYMKYNSDQLLKFRLKKDWLEYKVKSAFNANLYDECATYESNAPVKITVEYADGTTKTFE